MNAMQRGRSVEMNYKSQQNHKNYDIYDYLLAALLFYTIVH